MPLWLSNIFSAMRTIRFFGSQDYIVMVEGGIPSDSGKELNATTHPMLREHGYFGVLKIATEDDTGLNIHPIYDGSWSFAVSPCLEDSPLPDWPISRAWGSINEHSETLEIQVPKSARLTVHPPIKSQPKD
jgi:hypothetical protein